MLCLPHAIPQRPTMPSASDDLSPLQLAQELSQQALYLSDPNPRVGCVLVSSDGRLLGQGFTQAAGGPHAEVMALRDAAGRGANVRGATAYVTLEPCSHHGRTGPCCDALIAAGVAQVVASLRDPNPKVAGQGFARLQAAGITVTVLPPDAELAQAARVLNIGFISRMVRKTPWVRMKIAGSLDGRTALPDGTSQWITSEPARRDGHAWRARASAVLTGIGTVLQDRPRLDVRLVETPRQPWLAIVDSQWRTPPDAPLFLKDRPVRIYGAGAVSATHRQTALIARGAQLVSLPERPNDTHAPTRVDLAAMLRDLATQEVNELHVEAGQILNGALLQAGLVDELLLYLAPRLLGAGPGLAQWLPPAPLSSTPALRINRCDMVGSDLRLLAEFNGRPAF